MSAGVPLRKTTTPDSEHRSMDEIMATIREIISREGLVADYPSPSSPSNNNQESLFLEMEDQLRKE